MRVFGERDKLQPISLFAVATGREVAETGNCRQATAGNHAEVDAAG
jgi:hypothetical protein